MGLESAELTKVTANAFLALKISFANSIARLADATDADVLEVMDAVGADNRIGRAFLNAGRGYGGGCFPKDVKGLISSAQSHQIDMDIMQAASLLNESMPDYVITKLEQAIGDVKDQQIMVAGLAFKAGTSDVRQSPGIKIANALAKRGARVSAYDPQANEEAKPELESTVSLYDSFDEAAEGVRAIIIATEWDEFKEVSWSDYANICLVDAMNMLDSSTINTDQLQYVGIGRSI